MICLLGNFPVSLVAGCMYTLLAGNSSFCLAGSEEQINFFQQSPKMLKMASESFFHAFLLCLGLFLKISRWVPLSSENQDDIMVEGVVSRSKRKAITTNALAHAL